MLTVHMLLISPKATEKPKAMQYDPSKETKNKLLSIRTVTEILPVVMDPALF
jgi:hypothetical protein